MTNFYKKFIKNFNKIIISLTKLLKNSNVFVKKLHRRRKFKFKFLTIDRNSFLDKKTKKTFETLKKTFITILVFCYFDSTKSLRIKTNVFNKVIDVIFCQFNENDYWYFIAFLLQKLIFTKCNYEIYNKKLLIIVKFFKHWRHYFKSAIYKILILTNYHNFKKFIKTTRLFLR